MPQSILWKNKEVSKYLWLEKEKQQITGTFAISQSSEFLPMQLIYEGKTTRCLPKNVIFPKGFNIAFTKNDWSNEEKAVELLNKIIFPYIDNVKERLDLPSDQKAKLIFDVFRGQTTANVIQHITHKGCVVLYAPNNMTNYFQMLDLNVNGQAKEFLKKKFEVWYAEQVTEQIKAGRNIYDVEVPMKMSDMKPIHARWVTGLCDHLKNSKEMILTSWQMSGLEEAYNKELPPEDPFADLDL